MSNYTKGRSFEYAIKKLFVDDGYTVTRAAGSKGPWDLVAIKPGKSVWLTVLVQCKLNQTKEPPVATFNS